MIAPPPRARSSGRTPRSDSARSEGPVLAWRSGAPRSGVGPTTGFHPDPFVGVLARQVSWVDAREVRCVNRVPGQPCPRSLGPAVTCPCPRMAPSPSRVSACLATPRLFQERGWFVVGPLRSQPQQGVSKGRGRSMARRSRNHVPAGVSTEMAPSGAALQTPQLAGTSAELVDASTEGVRIRRVAGLHHLEELQGAFPVPQHR